MAAPAPRRAGPRALGFLLLALGPVAAMEIYTPGVLEVLNGTNVRLKCTFRSSFPVGQKLTVSWYFQTEMKEPPESVLYYNYQAYPSKSGRFLGRLTWDGNVHKNDASVMLHNASPKDNGTFQCHVKNPPDVDGVIGEIQLSVVLKVSFSEVHILVLTISISCAVMVTVVVVVVTWRHWRRMQRDKETEVDGVQGGAPSPSASCSQSPRKENPLRHLDGEMKRLVGNACETKAVILQHLSRNREPERSPRPPNAAQASCGLLRSEQLSLKEGREEKDAPLPGRGAGQS
ncbi:myelin protein zero-like protein 2 isoform 2-T2 [Liasis olivaceus]